MKLNPILNQEISQENSSNQGMKLSIKDISPLVNPYFYIKKGKLVEYIKAYKGDGQLIARVFDNLLSNAVKYGKDGKKIKIEVLNDDETVTIKIMNYGNPIDSADLPYIFDKFYRSDASRSSSTGGTGLGLAIAKNIIQIHNGEILATSHQDKTTFIVILHRLHTNE